MSTHKGMRRWQLEAHLALHGWVPASNGTTYLLRNAHEMVIFRSSQWCERQPDKPGATPYFLNDRWPLCEWADVPDVPLRQMATCIQERPI